MTPYYVTYILFFGLVTLFACEQSNEQTLSRKDQVEVVAKNYFATFAERRDWEKLCSFYREDLHFEDVMLQLKLDSLWQFKRFYKWDKEGGNFRKMFPEQDHISIHSLVVNDTMAVGYGRVNPFYYYDRLIDVEWGMKAIFWLYFDDSLKIKRQVDWIEYDPEVLQSVIDRFHKQGVEVSPDWLDLSR